MEKETHRQKFSKYLQTQCLRKPQGGDSLWSSWPHSRDAEMAKCVGNVTHPITKLKQNKISKQKLTKTEPNNNSKTQMIISLDPEMTFKNQYHL